MADSFGRNRRGGGLSLVFVLFLLVASGGLFAGEVGKKEETQPAGRTDYVLKIEKGRISLNAKDASLKHIVEEIGRELNIEVAALISQGDRITVEFQALPLEDALKRMSSNYYVHFREAESDKWKISKIVLLPKGDGKGQSVIPHTEGADGRVEGSQTMPGKTAREQVIETQQEEALKDKTPRPEPFKFEFNP